MKIYNLKNNVLIWMIYHVYGQMKNVISFKLKILILVQQLLIMVQNWLVWVSIDKDSNVNI